MKETLFFLFCWGAYLQAAPTICLNMIVKNEKHVIEKCLHSVKGIIDYWVIVDTGSDDGTQMIIKECLKEIPGELHEKPWVNFCHNRQEALDLAHKKGDYILLMDADEILEIEKSFDKRTLSHRWYVVPLSDYTHKAQRVLFFDNRLHWFWKDVIHEHLIPPPGTTRAAIVEGITCYTKYDGYRSQDPQKFLKDAAVLEKELEKDPTNSRYIFYLAQSYFNAKEYPLALKYHLQRVEMGGGWQKEIFWSSYVAGKLQELLGMPAEQFIKSYRESFQHDPSRAEPLFRLADYFFRQENYILSYLIAKSALTIPPACDEMYAEHWIYEYGIPLAAARSAQALGKDDEANLLYQNILQKSPPQAVQKQIEEHLTELRKQLIIK